MIEKVIVRIETHDGMFMEQMTTPMQIELCKSDMLNDLYLMLAEKERRQRESAPKSPSSRTP